MDFLPGLLLLVFELGDLLHPHLHHTLVVDFLLRLDVAFHRDPLVANVVLELINCAANRVLPFVDEFTLVPKDDADANAPKHHEQTFLNQADGVVPPHCSIEATGHSLRRLHWCLFLALKRHGLGQ